MNRNEAQTIEIDLVRLLSVFWKKKYLIAFVCVLCAVIMVIGAAVFTTPKYQADILIYVNNNSVSLGNASISFNSGEINAARQLLDSYVVALKSRSCLDSVIEKAGLQYSREELNRMVTAKAVNGTEWFTVAVTSKIPEEAQLIADTIAKVLPDILSNTIKGSSVVVVDMAVKPEHKVSPGSRTYAAYGFIIGFLLIAAYIVVKEALDNKIHNEETLAGLSDSTIPVLANIPEIGKGGAYSKYGYGYANKRGNSLKSKIDNGFESVGTDLGFAIGEAYKVLQTSVQYSFNRDGCKVIGVTSSERNEGKSTISVNLAYVLSCEKQKVLLLDGDLRLPSVSKKLRITSKPGLSDYLVGKVQSDKIIQYSSKAPALSVITAGTIPPNPYELLGSESMDRFLKALRNHYDYIIIDLPPVNIVSDPLALAKHLDGFVLSVRCEFTTKQGLKDVINKLKIVNSTIIGYVLHGGDNSLGSKYGNYKKYGSYGNQYRDSAKRSGRTPVKKKTAHAVSSPVKRETSKKK